MYIVLEDDDYKDIAQQIIDERCDKGVLYTDISGVDCFEVAYTCDVDGYTENDYFSGTGAFVATSAQATCTIKNELCKVLYDKQKVESMIEKMILE